jgi:hypothetical protein
MNTREKGCLWLLVVIIGAIPALYLVNLLTSTWPRSLNCRRTVTVDTPEGPRVGTSVFQRTANFPGNLNLMRAQGYAVSLGGQGDATVIDLGARGVLFATLAAEKRLVAGDIDMSGANCETPFPRAKFSGPTNRYASSTDEYVAYLDELNRQKPKANLGSKDLPMLVRFRDLNNPATVERVDPADLAASFGPGVKLEGISIEITDAPVTHGIEAILPWLKENLHTRRLIPPTPGRLSDLPPVELLSYDDLRKQPE